MTDLKSIIAAINDDYHLKSRDTIKILYELMSSDAKNFDDIIAFLDGIASQKSHPRRETCLGIIDRINSVDFNYYTNYVRTIEQSDIDFIPFYSVLYPRELWSIEHPPLCLYLKGDTSALFGGIAIVGTRKATEQRKQFVYKLANHLAGKGYPIVSGLAKGIDAEAHKGAIERNGQTIAVLPGDIESIRPASNRDLAKKIPNNGALVAELSDNPSIHKGRFVERNRITSGISLAVVVGASRTSGGTVRQAEFAQNQFKPRFMYDPQNEDGQSPDKLSELGLKSFSSIEELENLLNSEWSEIKPQHTITDYKR
jgi:DNA processing protein